MCSPNSRPVELAWPCQQILGDENPILCQKEIAGGPFWESVGEKLLGNRTRLNTFWGRFVGLLALFVPFFLFGGKTQKESNVPQFSDCNSRAVNGCDNFIGTCDFLVLSAGTPKRGRKTGTTRKLSKIFSTLFDAFCPARKMSKSVDNIFDTFWWFSAWPLFAGHFCGPLILSAGTPSMPIKFRSFRGAAFIYWARGFFWYI